MMNPTLPDLEHIKARIPPPSDPKGLDHDWEFVERDLGTSLPSDYKQIIDTYGSGLFGGMIWVWNWRDASLQYRPLEFAKRLISSYVRQFDALKSQGYKLGYPVYPEPGGLLPFATVIDVHNLNWLTEGPPDKWDIVYWHFDGNEMIHLPGDNLSRFLLNLFNNKYDRPIGDWDVPFEFTDFSNW